MIELAKRRRRAHVMLRDELLGFQKAAKDRDAARFFSQEAKEALKRERAVNAVLAVLDGPVGPVGPVAAEIAPYFALEWAACECGIEAA